MPSVDIFLNTVHVNLKKILLVFATANCALHNVFNIILMPDALSYTTLLVIQTGDQHYSDLINAPL